MIQTALRLVATCCRCSELRLAVIALTKLQNLQLPCYRSLWELAELVLVNDRPNHQEFVLLIDESIGHANNTVLKYRRLLKGAEIRTMP